MSPEQSLDMKISKIRSLVDWRVNDLSRVLRQTEETWSEQIDGERRSRQESVDVIQGLIVMLDERLKSESTRVEAVLQDFTNFQVEHKVLTDVTAETGDEVQDVKRLVTECREEVEQIK